MYRIGQFSKINKVTVKTLRFYDEIGILKPSFVDKENGYRYYTSEQLPKLHKIMAWRQMGFSIEEISLILRGHNIEGIFQGRKAELKVAMSEIELQISQISHYLEKMEEGFNMNYQVVVKELPEVIVYSKRMVVPDYNAYFEIIPKIGEAVAKANPGLKCVEPAYCFIIYHDGEYKEKDIDVEFCEAVETYGTEVDGVKFKTMDNVPEAACVYHKGPYKTLGAAYAHVFKWIEENGYTACAGPRESHIDGIWNKEDENEWLTELQVPIVKK